MKQEINFEEEETYEETPLRGAQFQESESDKNRSDNLALCLIACISIIQGIPVGFFIGTVSLTLAEKGASYGDLSQFSIVLLPYALKVFIAPIVDTYYWEKLGKRKTYIVPALLLIGILFVVNSFFINDFIAERKVGLLTLFGLLCMSMMSFMDIANDAWILTIVHKENYPIASAFQGMAGLLGFFIAFNMLVPLTSVEFLNKYIFSEPRTEPLITFQDFILGSGIFILIVAVMAWLFPEKKPKPRKNLTVKEVIKTFKQFYYNKNLRYLAILLLTVYIPFEGVISVLPATLVKKGFQKDTISNIVTIILPLIMVVGFAAGKVVKAYEKKNFTIYFIAYMSVGIFLALPVFIIVNFDKDVNYDQTAYWLVFAGLYFAAFVSLGVIAYSSFILRITHESMASTFIAAVNSLNNLGRLWPETAGLALGNFIDVRIMLIFALVWIAFYQYFIRNYIIPLQEKDTKDFGFYLPAPDGLETEASIKED